MALARALSVDPKVLLLDEPFGALDANVRHDLRRWLREIHDELGITTTCVFGGFEGESYADIPTVKRTVGLVPYETRAARLAELKEIADFARLLNVDVVGVHLGFVPHDVGDPDYAQMIELTRDICDHCRRNRQSLHLETGQEPVDVLIRFLDDVERDNLFVNFDPANMILYGAGEPLPALVEKEFWEREFDKDIRSLFR